MFLGHIRPRCQHEYQLFSAVTTSKPVEWETRYKGMFTSLNWTVGFVQFDSDEWCELSFIVAVQDCGECLKSGRCYEGSDGFPYCERHIVCEGRSPQCAGCGGPILGRCVSAMSRRYHVEHFVCTFCRQPLLRGAFREFEARPYCCACFIRLGGRWEVQQKFVSGNFCRTVSCVWHFNIKNTLA